MADQKTFDQVLKEAIDDMSRNGFDTAERLAYWQERLRRAAEASMTPQDKMEQMLREALRAVYRRMVERGGVVRLHPGVGRFQVDRLTPQMRRELDKHILASADLIRLNKKEAVEKTLRRFAGWATSVPAGGSDQVDKRSEKERIRKSMSGLPFVERRVLVDQGHKLESSISEVVATNTGAIAGIWRSNWRQANYDYREDHKERDEVVYVVRGNWAMEKGLMKLAGHKYTDDITRPSEEPFCRCKYQYIYSLRRLPEEMLTEKGKSELQRLAAQREI